MFLIAKTNVFLSRHSHFRKSQVCGLGPRPIVPSTEVQSTPSHPRTHPPPAWLGLGLGLGLGQGLGLEAWPWSGLGLGLGLGLA